MHAIQGKTVNVLLTDVGVALAKGDTSRAAKLLLPVEQVIEAGYPYPPTIRKQAKELGYMLDDLYESRIESGRFDD